MYKDIHNEVIYQLSAKKNTVQGISCACLEILKLSHLILFLFGGSPIIN